MERCIIFKMTDTIYGGRVQIANSLSHKRYGFVFGYNTFLALVMEAILTAIVVDEAGLGVDVRTQFAVYGGYFAFMTLVFLIVAGIQLYRGAALGRNGTVQFGIMKEDIKDSETNLSVHD